MAHFVKLIGSLQHDGTRLVPLNFSFDYTTKTSSDLFRTVHYNCVTISMPVNYRRETMSITDLRNTISRHHFPNANYFLILLFSFYSHLSSRNHYVAYITNRTRRFRVLRRTNRSRALFHNDECRDGLWKFIMKERLVIISLVKRIPLPRTANVP